MKKKWLLLLSILLLLIIILCVVFAFVIKDDKEKTVIKKESRENIDEKKLQIIDLTSNSRPYAVMINNINTVWGYQAGLQDAYIVYEIMVEGGYTRLMALFKDKELSRIGTVRSSRHYFLDYAKENDAVYVHFGWSPQAQTDMTKLDVDNINFMTYQGYTRDYSLGLATEHTVFTTTQDISNGIDKYNYKKTSEGTLLNYSIDEIDLQNNVDNIVANQITINYSNNHTTTFTYDNINKVYKRSQNNQAHIDYVTKNQYTAKNIIVYQVNCYTIDNKGRINIDNIGSQEGYYITDGYAVPIIATKDSRTSKTIYKTKDGKEIKVNDGNTFIEIAPLGKELTIN